MPIVVQKCGTCNELFETPSWRIRNGKGKFCSRTCYDENTSLRQKGKLPPCFKLGQGETKNCSNCGIPVYINPARLRKHKLFFCSKSCEGQWRSGPRNSFFGKKHTQKTLLKILRSVHGRPNGPERTLIRLCQDFNLPFRFVGDGSLIIDGMNPDFVGSINPQLIIEVFGRYWHQKRPTPFRKTETGRVLAYENLGYKCLVVWEEELKNPNEVARKVCAFFGMGKSLEVVR